MADPDSEFTSAFQVNTSPYSKKDYLTYLLPQLLLAKKDGFSQRELLLQRSHYEGKSLDIRPTLFLLREGRVVFEWRLNYADHCTEIIHDLILLINVNNGVSERILREEEEEEHEKSSSSSLTNSMTPQQYSQRSSSSQQDLIEVRVQERPAMNESSIESREETPQTTFNEGVVVIPNPNVDISQHKETPESMGGSSAPEVELNPSTPEELSSQILDESLQNDSPHITTEQAIIPSSMIDPSPFMHSEFIAITKDVPKYRRIPSSPLVQVISSEMKEQEQSERTKRAKRILERQRRHEVSTSSNERSRTIRISCICSFDSVEMDASIDLRSVLNDSKKRRYFKLFSHYEYNAENLLFWEEVHVYYKPNAYISKYGKAKKLAHSIGQQFLFDSSSVLFINTNDKLREEVRTQMKRLFKYHNTHEVKHLSSEEQVQFNALAPLLFDSILNEMMTQVLPDMFVRFKVSPLFNEMEHKTNLSK